MSWSGQEIYFNHENDKIGISCKSVADGVLITYQHNNKTSSRVFSDETLCKYIGIDMYCSFEYAAKQLKEPVSQTDFNNSILQNDIPIENIKNCLNAISNIVPTGSQVINTWRRMKCVIAATSVLITEYNWSEQGNNSQNLVNSNTNIKQYMEGALDEISNNSQSLTCQKSARFFRNQINNYTQLLGDRNYITCYGIIPPTCQECENVIEEITWGPCLFWFFIIVLVILLIWAWLKQGHY